MHVNRLIGIFVAAFAFFLLFGQALPVTDPVESNYALTAKEMVLSHDWVSPRIYGEVWFDKPAMFYWLLAAGYSLFGFTEIAARIVPACFGALGVTLLYWFTARVANHRQALIAAVILGTSFQYFLLSKLLITDSVLFVFNAASLVCFYSGYSATTNKQHWYWLMYAFFGLAVLTKGPVGVLLPGLVMLLFLAHQRKWSELGNMKILTGVLIFTAVALPWFVTMYIKHGEAFVQSFFGVHNYLRATVSEHPKDNVFYYYFAILPLSVMPWTGVVLGGMYEACRKVRNGCGLAAFLLIWLVTFFSFYSLMATKYVTYIFPVLFPAAILAGQFTERLIKEYPRKLGYWVGIPLTLLLVIFAAASYLYLGRINVILVIAISAPVLAYGLWTLVKGNGRRMATAALVCVMVSYLLLSAFVLPIIAQTRSGKEFAGQLMNYRNYQIGTYKFYSTSAVFYSGTVLTRIEDRDTVNAFRQDSLDWSAKYTMPINTVQEFADHQGGNKLLIIVPKLRKQQFEAQMAGGAQWVQLGQSDAYLFYQLETK